MENKNIFQELARYRVRIERDGKSVVNVPGIICLPALLTAPRLGIAGMIAAPLLGYSVHLENEDGKAVDVEKAVRETAETVMETAADTARTIREKMDKAWQAVSADDPESGANEETEDEDVTSVPDAESNEDIVEDLKKHEEDDIPTIQVKPDDSAQE